MNASKLLAKYEMLAEIAHKTGAYACARKWSIKAEKLEAVISAIESIKEPTMKQITREEAAELIRQHLESIESEQYKANVWVKEGRVRIYLKDLAFTNKQDKGFFAFNGDGSALYDSISGSGSGRIIDEIREVLKSVEVLGDKEAQRKIQASKEIYKKANEILSHNDGIPRRLTREEAETLANRKSLAAPSNKGEWCFGAVDEESF